ncbi:hypothetical protein F4V43_01970 [Paenibacillus spiritus]|uniref:Uncharacterized protein n=1 Tax=Paenibacillus spiritus TaxID=2496557 RepID=A0A5J5GGD8_9BACL|nr:hypothetical protein [Paenibacillus spiritus]KAA9007276.1 hypothetical protein F4V43_01970 [Paenibacillus spiritus]
MVKVKITRTSIIEYELIPEHYPEGYTFEQMAEEDANHDDRESLFSDCVSDEVVWEIIKE